MKLFNIPFDDISFRDVIKKVISPKGFNLFVFTNINMVVGLNKNKKILKEFLKSNLILCDSKIISLLSIFFAKRIKNVVPGSFLTEYLFKNVFTKNDEIFIVGSDFKSINNLTKTYGLKNLNFFIPSFGFINQQSELQDILFLVKKVKPKYLFLAVGFPQQEKLAFFLSSKLNFDVSVFCVGAAIDFLTGKKKRAPLIFRYFHLEWFFRILQEPKRLIPRYFNDFIGFIRLFIL